MAGYRVDFTSNLESYPNIILGDKEGNDFTELKKAIRSISYINNKTKIYYN
jgi:hypothetical protein